MEKLFRCVVSGLVAAALAAANIGPAVAADAATPATSDATAASSGCQVDNEDAFRAEIDKLTYAAILKGMDGVDYPALTNAAWHATGTDTVLDQRVEKSIAEVQEESSWSALLQ